jgi:tRNA pseudouridine synthase 10
MDELLEDARRLMETGPLCLACLGRPFAQRSFGLSNDERGKALAVTLSMSDDEPYEQPEPSECWVCEGICGEYDEWADRVVDVLADTEFDTYQVGTRVPPLIEENDQLLREDAGLDADAGELFKSAFNREVGKRVGKRTDTEVDFERPDVLALCNLQRGDVDVQVNSTFVYGRYRKLERDIPQTEWPCNECDQTGERFGDPCDNCGGKGWLYESSVEEEVCPHVREAMDGEEALFHGAGREDVDALMLGTGRPFVAEVKRPGERTPDVESLEARINEAAEGRVEVEGLRLGSHELVERVKELDASKTYRMDVSFEEPIEASTLEAAMERLDGATIEQYTPQRVDHRRASTTRTREVYSIEGRLEDDQHAELEVHGAGGLYVKELVSGDEGRTEPSLAGELGVEATVTALDVLAVEGEAEPFEDESLFR